MITLLSFGKNQNSQNMSEKNKPLLFAPRYLSMQAPQDKVSFTARLKVIDVPGIICPYCGGLIESIPQQDEFGKKVATATGHDLQLLLQQKFQQKKRTLQKQMANFLIDKSRVYPDKNLQELLQTIAPQVEDKLMEKQLTILRKAKRQTSALQGETKQKAESVLDNSIQMVLARDKNHPFQRKPITSAFFRLQEAEQNSPTQKTPEQLRSIANNRCVIQEVNLLLRKLPKPVKKLSPKVEDDLVAKHVAILQEARKRVENAQGETRQKAEAILDKSIQVVLERKQNSLSQRKQITASLFKLSEADQKVSAPKTPEELKRIASNRKVLREISIFLRNLPKSSNSKNAFIVKYQRRSSEDIGKALLQPYVATEDHLDPFSKSHDDSIVNKASTHYMCNGPKQDYDFEFFVDKTKHIYQYFVESFNSVNKAVDRGDLPKETYGDYSPNVSLRIYKLSKGKLQLPFVKSYPPLPAPKKQHPPRSGKTN